jgi:hypothetical protein
LILRRSAVAFTLVLAALLLGACGGGGSSSSSGSSTSTAATKAKTPEQVWAKEIEGVMRKLENSSAQSVAGIHTSTSQPALEPTYAEYADELDQLGKQLEATDAPANCTQVRDQMGRLARKVSDIMGVLGDQADLNRDEYFALVYQQRYKFARVGRQLTDLTIDPHC